MSDSKPGRAAGETTIANIWRPSRPSSGVLLDLVIGGIVLVAYAVLQLTFLQGPHPYDPAKYFTTAVHFPDVPVDLWTLRIGLIAPVRIAVILFDPSEAALYAVPLAAGLLLTGAVYGVMLLFFGDRVVAAAAALVTGLNTSILLNSSFIFPDTLATATFTAGFFFLVLGGLKSEGRYLTVLTTASVIFAGVLFGWSYLIREFSPVLLPAVVAAVVLLGYRWRHVAILAGAAVMTASLELLYGLVRYDKPFIHLDALTSHGDRPFSSTVTPKAEHIQGLLDNPLDAFLVFPRLVLAWQVGWAVLVLVTIFVATALWLRDRRLWILAAWCFAFWAVMTIFGSWTLPSGRWIINVTNIRYWYPIFPAVVMGAFGGLYLLLRRLYPTARGALAAQALSVTLALLTLIPGFVEFQSCAAKNPWRNDPAARWDQLRSWFATPEAERYRAVFTDRLTYRVLPAYTRTTFGTRLWTGKLRTFPSARSRLVPAGNLEDSLILINKDRLGPILQDSENGLQGLANEWSPIFVSDDGVMVVLRYAPTTMSRVETEPAWWLPPEPVAQQQEGCGLSPYEPAG